jgi:hypothetical protein
MRLVCWGDLAHLVTRPDTYWLVFRLPHDASTWAQGIFVSPRMNLPRLRGDEFGIYCRQTANITLGRAVPGKAVLKALLIAMRNNVLSTPWALPHVDCGRCEVHTRHGVTDAVALTGVFSIFVWLWGAPSVA